MRNIDNTILERKKMKTIDLSSDSSEFLLKAILATIPLWALAILSEAPIVADVAALTGIIAVSRWFWSILGSQKKMIGLINVSAAALVVIQNLAWLSSSLLHRFSLDVSIEYSLSIAMIGGLKFASYSTAVLYITIFSLVLTWLASSKFVQKLEHTILNKLLLLNNFPTSKLLLFILFICGIEILLISSGVIGQRTLIIEGLKAGERPAWITFFESMLSMQLILNAFLVNKYLSNRIKGINRNAYIFITLGSVLVVLFLYFNKGRSSLVYCILAQFYWFIFFSSKRPNIFKWLPVSIVAYLFLSEILLFSNFIRSSKSGIVDWRISAIEVLPQAWENFKSNPDAVSVEEKRTQKNISTRALVAKPLALAIQLPVERKNYLLGEGLRNSAIWALPSIIFPNKSDFPVQETLLYRNFPIGDRDTSDSVYLSSYTDFGWFGLLIYPFFIAGLWLLILQIFKLNFAGPLLISIILGIFFQLSILGIGESSLITWFTTLRSTMIWMLVGLTIKLVFKKRY